MTAMAEREASMATNAPNASQPKGDSLWKRLDRFLIRGSRIEIEEVSDEAARGGDLQIKPGWTIKGL